MMMMMMMMMKKKKEEEGGEKRLNEQKGEYVSVKNETERERE